MVLYLFKNKSIIKTKTDCHQDTKRFKTSSTERHREGEFAEKFLKPFGFRFIIKKWVIF